MDIATLILIAKIAKAAYPIVGDRLMDFISGKTSELEISDVEIISIDEALVEAGVTDEFINDFYRRAGAPRADGI